MGDLNKGIQSVDELEAVTAGSLLLGSLRKGQEVDRVEFEALAHDGEAKRLGAERLEFAVHGALTQASLLAGDKKIDPQGFNVSIRYEEGAAICEVTPKIEHFKQALGRHSNHQLARKLIEAAGAEERLELGAFTTMACLATLKLYEGVAGVLGRGQAYREVLLEKAASIDAKHAASSFWSFAHVMGTIANQDLQAMQTLPNVGEALRKRRRWAQHLSPSPAPTKAPGPG